VQKTCLPNPDDKLIEIRWNVMVTASERKKLLEIIKKKLRVSDENDAVEWLATLAEKVSGWKAKSGMIATDRDADFILDKIERQAKFREVTNG
jgi:putative heme iron utilization protein